MNLYLPSVKLAKKVRLASKLRRVMQRGTDALERVVASGQAGWRMTELRKLCSTLDPFQLANRIDRKLEYFCTLPNRRPKPEASKFALRDGCRKAAPRKSPQKNSPTALGIPQKTQDSHFPTATTVGIRLRPF